MVGSRSGYAPHVLVASSREIAKFLIVAVLSVFQLVCTCSHGTVAHAEAANTYVAHRHCDGASSEGSRSSQQSHEKGAACQHCGVAKLTLAEGVNFSTAHTVPAPVFTPVLLPLPAVRTPLLVGLLSARTAPTRDHPPSISPHLTCVLLI